MRIQTLPLVFFGLVLSATGAFAEPAGPTAGEMVTLKTAAGRPFKGYVAGPEDARRGILVIHEWWGLNEHIKDWADRFAALGYRALAIDLYDGKVATTASAARQYKDAVDQSAANTKHRAALAHLKAPGRRLATIGFCFGGGQSLQASLADPESVAATVIYYGSLVTDAASLKTLRGPALGIFGSHDENITPEKVKAFEEAMKKAGKELEVHSYEASHAFANPAGARYDEKAAKESWAVTRAFLDTHLR